MNGPEPPPPEQPPTSSLIVSGKRARRKVNLSAEFLYNAPVRLGRSRAVPDDDASHGDAPSPANRKRRRSSTTTKGADELITKRNRLQQRKAELEAYLNRLQVALAVERNHANGVGPAPSQLAMAADPAAALPHPLPVENGFREPTRIASVRRKSVPPKKKESRPAPPVIVDDDSVEISLKHCIRIIDDLIHNQYGDVFATPVDWEALGLPSYPEIVKQPMDLGTIRQRLITAHYAALSAFIADVQLVWDNAKKFNMPKSFVHEATLEMERIWNRKKDSLKRERRRSLLAANNRDLTAAESPAAAPVLAPSNAIPLNHFSKPLSILEMSKLRADLVRIPADQYSRISEITGCPIVEQPDGGPTTIHVDIDKLTVETQRRLQQFVASVLPKPAPPPRSRPAPSAAMPPKRLSNSMTSVATAVISSESDSDSSSSSGLESESSDDEAPFPPPPPIASQPPPPPQEEVKNDDVVNTDAWSNLEAVSETAAAVNDDGNEDPLWSDYQSMSAEAQQRERERRAQEEARRQDLERLAQERTALDEKAREEREAAEQQRAVEAAEREQERTRLISEEREKARRALERDETEADDHADLGFLSSIFRS